MKTLKYSFLALLVGFGSIALAGTQESDSSGADSSRTEYTKASELRDITALIVFGIFRTPITIYENVQDRRQAQQIVESYKKTPTDQWFIECAKDSDKINLIIGDNNAVALDFNSKNQTVGVHSMGLDVKFRRSTDIFEIDASDEIANEFSKIKNACIKNKTALGLLSNVNFHDLSKNMPLSAFLSVSVSGNLIKIRYPRINTLRDNAALDYSVRNGKIACAQLGKSLVTIKAVNPNDRSSFWWEKATLNIDGSYLISQTPYPPKGDLIESVTCK